MESILVYTSMPPKTRSKVYDLSPIPVAGFMPPPPRKFKPTVVVKPKSAAPKPASGKKPSPSKKSGAPVKAPVKAAAPPSKAAAAKDIEAAAKALLKLSRQLTAKRP